MWLVRSALVVVTLACSSHSPSAPPPRAPTTDDAVATPTLVDAAVAPDATLVVLPGTTQCTGHWTAKVDFEGACGGAGAPYESIDAVFAAGEHGWAATLAKPAGLTIASTKVRWYKNYRSCHVTLVARDERAELEVELERGRSTGGRWINGHNLPRDQDLALVGAKLTVPGGAEPCKRYAIIEATYAPDAGGMPPANPDDVALTGAYDLTLSIPSKYKCDAMPSTAVSFSIAIDRDQSDELVIQGLEQASVSASAPGEVEVSFDAEYELWNRLKLRVDGATVTGELDVSDERERAEGYRNCKPLKGAKVTGTHTPSPR